MTRQKRRLPDAGNVPSSERGTSYSQRSPARAPGLMEILSVYPVGLLRLQQAAGNRAATQFVQRMDSSEAGPSAKRQKRSGKEPEVPASTPGAGVPEDLRQWMSSETTNPSSYGLEAEPPFVREIQKSDMGAACWNWAVAAMQNDGVSQEAFWGRLIKPKEEARSGKGRGKKKGQAGEVQAGEGQAGEPDWFLGLEQAVRDQITSVNGQLAQGGLLPTFTGSGRSSGLAPGKAPKLKGLMKEAVEIYVRMNGLTVAKENPQAWVVCQYKPAEKAAVPEHWWIELLGVNGRRVVIQTVPGKPLEIGGGSSAGTTKLAREGSKGGAVKVSYTKPLRSLLRRSRVNTSKFFAREWRGSGRPPTRRLAPRLDNLFG